MDWGLGVDKTGFPVGIPFDMTLLNTLFCHQKRGFKALKCGSVESLLHDCGLLAWSDPRTKPQASTIAARLEQAADHRWNRRDYFSEVPREANCY